MDKQVNESEPQQRPEKLDKMVAPEDITYSQHDEKKEATRKNSQDADGHINTEDEINQGKKE
jgi:hypothetical protein